MENINAGDTVYIARGTSCCGWLPNGTYGITFTVKKIEAIPPYSGKACPNCGVLLRGQLRATSNALSYAVPLAVLKKLPKRSTKQEKTEEVTA